MPLKLIEGVTDRLRGICGIRAGSTQIRTISPAFAGISLHVTEAWQYLAALQQSTTAASAINTDVYTATACQFEGNLMNMVQTGQLAVVSQAFYI